MAFDAEPGGDPRGPNCPKCGQLILPHQPTTMMHFADRSSLWHGECARPYWDTLTPLLDRLKSGGWS
ncbi:MAG TPA: hypothetical protein VGH86_18065 [Phenylobacterium sp.]|jgi:hypothetical protein